MIARQPLRNAQRAFSATSARAGMLKRAGAGPRSDFKAVSSVLNTSKIRFSTVASQPLK